MKTYYLIEDTGNILILSSNEKPQWVESSGWKETPEEAFNETHKDFVKKAKHLSDQMDNLKLKYEIFVKKITEYNQRD